MNEADNRDRTESPTQKRIDDARKRGQVPRSRDLGAAAVTLAGGLGLYSLGGLLGGRLLSMMRSGLELSASQSLGADSMQQALGTSALAGAQAAAPLLGLLLAAAVLAPLAIGGWNFSATALVPQWDRLDPFNGLKRVFSLRGVLELLKSLARFGVVALVAVLVLRHQFRVFSSLSMEPTHAAIGHALRLAGSALIFFGGALAFIAAIDVPLALWQHYRSLRMTRQEIREELRDTEGSPELRGRIRRVQQEMASRRMMAAVPTADVVVTNPTHYAVALRYDEARMRAPIVVAKGADLVAQRIRELAAEHKVPLVEAPPLARALHKTCELGDEIPARLYAVVAQVLTYVYQLRTARRTGAEPPTPPVIDAPETPEL
ncbi:MAG: flagellar biosynthesis protein FlhB [Proteobacteria bacterium]|nr:flagellar biosynthesis protein FlhB [Pseudomonadota bacterium]